nr:protein suppressor of gene silencing 3 [Tanacetum cinerariifolium]
MLSVWYILLCYAFEEEIPDHPSDISPTSDWVCVVCHGNCKCSKCTKIHRNKEGQNPPPPLFDEASTSISGGDTWIGMRPKRLLEYHKSSGAVQARHAIGAEGHKGISVLIFDTSAEGYAKAQLLSKKYECQGIGRANWSHNPSLFHHSGSRQLYGYLSTFEDLEDFNQDLPGMYNDLA